MLPWRIFCCGEKRRSLWSGKDEPQADIFIPWFKSFRTFQLSTKKRHFTTLIWTNLTQLVSQSPFRSFDWDMRLKSRKIKPFFSPLLVVWEANPVYCEMMRPCYTCNKPSDLRLRQTTVKFFNYRTSCPPQPPHTSTLPQLASGPAGFEFSTKLKSHISAGIKKQAARKITKTWFHVSSCLSCFCAASSRRLAALLDLKSQSPRWTGLPHKDTFIICCSVKHTS